MSTIEEQKQEFRTSDTWREFREDFLAENTEDYITHKSLKPDAHVHHLCETDSIEEYKKLDPERFVPLNEKMHDVVHAMYSEYCRDPAVIDRLKDVLDKMKSYSQQVPIRRMIRTAPPVLYKPDLPAIEKGECQQFIAVLNDRFQWAVAHNSGGVSYNDLLASGLSADLLDRLAQWHFIAFNYGKDAPAFIPWHESDQRMVQYRFRTIDMLREISK